MVNLVEAAKLAAVEFRNRYNTTSPSGLINPEEDWYKAACAFASGLANIQFRDQDVTIKYLSEWPDRFAAVAEFCIVNPQGQILLTERASNAPPPGWCFPGGHSEGENFEWMSFLEDITKGELFAETGLHYTANELARAVQFTSQHQDTVHGEAGKRFIRTIFYLFPDEKRLATLGESKDEVQSFAFHSPETIINQEIPMAFGTSQLHIAQHALSMGIIRNRKLADSAIKKLKAGNLPSPQELEALKVLAITP
ncbi:MAG: NUDIX domain-containing protein [Alphaproteobacteria bacterium]|nr:NUDIX domain-containing protein [Alphaproteobacteria bacterium]MDD9919989.1 NUDIX domain-containing protein [Alphaproteobacteria bacterium]